MITNFFSFEENVSSLLKAIATLVKGPKATRVISPVIVCRIKRHFSEWRMPLFLSRKVKACSTYYLYCNKQMLQYFISVVPYLGTPFYIPFIFFYLNTNYKSTVGLYLGTRPYILSFLSKK